MHTFLDRNKRFYIASLLKMTWCIL